MLTEQQGKQDGHLGTWPWSISLCWHLLGYPYPTGLHSLPRSQPQALQMCGRSGPQHITLSV